MKWTILMIFLVNFQVILGQNSTACNANFLCTEDFCSSSCAPKVSNFLKKRFIFKKKKNFKFIFQDCEEPENTECDGIYLELYSNPKDFCSCCPRKCIKYLQENDPCFTQTPALPQEMCGPHLKCERSAGSSQAFCKPLNTPCENARKADLGFLQKPPECDAEGNFKPTQVSLNNQCLKKVGLEEIEKF